MYLFTLLHKCPFSDKKIVFRKYLMLHSVVEKKFALTFHTSCTCGNMYRNVANALNTSELPMEVIVALSLTTVFGKKYIQTSTQWNIFGCLFL
jgi:hypothetical protein